LIKNIFLDAGGVILNEDKFEQYSAEIITKIIKNYNTEYFIKNYWNDIEEAVYRFVPNVYDYILFKNISAISDFKEAKAQYKEDFENKDKKFELMDGIEEFLIEFSKDYKIGILGQYGKDFKFFLEDNKILQYFKFTETQNDYSITKPDPRYFEAILFKDKCDAKESIMVGDRIDKDIIPAKMVGMKTIRIRAGVHKMQEPRIPSEIPDITVKNLRELRAERIKEMDYCT
jgi:FMN phosphatase YigB (HAD superfamily)